MANRWMRLLAMVLVGGIGIGAVALAREGRSDAADPEVPLIVEAGAANLAPSASSPSGNPCARPGWVAAWSAAPQDTTASQPPHVVAEDGPPPQVFDDQTIRLIATPNGGGSHARLHLSNRFGSAAVSLGAVRVARAGTNGAVEPGTARPVTFGGATAVTLGPGEVRASDAIDVTVEPFVDLAVSVHVASASPLDIHLFAQQTQYVSDPATGDLTDELSGARFTTRLTSTLLLTALDVLAPRRTGAVVALGDSITDGIGSSVDGNQRWTDQLVRRINADAGGAALTVVNAGISGNQVTRDNVLLVNGAGFGMGPSAVTRMGRDVIARAGATDVVVLAGINDLYTPTGPDPAAAIIDGYLTIIQRARAAGLQVIGATMTPGGLTGEREAERQRVNDWIRRSGAFDRTVDLDAAVRDPANPNVVLPRLAADAVHLNDAGYGVIADAFDLDLFQGTGCSHTGPTPAPTDHGANTSEGQLTADAGDNP